MVGCAIYCYRSTKVHLQLVHLRFFRVQQRYCTLQHLCLFPFYLMSQNRVRILVSGSGARDSSRAIYMSIGVKLWAVSCPMLLYLLILYLLSNYWTYLQKAGVFACRSLKPSTHIGSISRSGISLLPVVTRVNRWIYYHPNFTKWY